MHSETFVIADKTLLFKPVGRSQLMYVRRMQDKKNPTKQNNNNSHSQLEVDRRCLKSLQQLSKKYVQVMSNESGVHVYVY